MPQPFNSAVMTDAGARLLTMSQAGEINIKFTRIAIGNGTYTEAEKDVSVLQEKTELKALKNSYAISSIQIISEHSVKVTALITNQNPVTGQALIEQGYYINEIGLYAKPLGGEDDTEVLYSIAVTTGENGDFMPPYNGYNPAQIVQDYIVTVSNNLDVTIQANMGAVALAEDLIDLRENIQTQLNSKISSSKIVKSTEISEEGFLMDGKTASDALAELNSNISHLKNWSLQEFKAAGWNLPDNTSVRWGGVIRTLGKNDVPPATNDNAFILNAYGGFLYSGYVSMSNPNTIVWHRIGG